MASRWKPSMHVLWDAKTLQDPEWCTEKIVAAR
jgi:hypothetical protein